MGSLPREKAGVGSAVNDTTRQMGGALGVAIIGSIVASAYAGGAAKVSREHGVTGVDAGPGTRVARPSARGGSSAARPRCRQRLRCGREGRLRQRAAPRPAHEWHRRSWWRRSSCGASCRRAPHDPLALDASDGLGGRQHHDGDAFVAGAVAGD